MSLNIKNEATHRRAKKLARLAGETMTEAVDRAIAERLERVTRIRNRARLVERAPAHRTRVRGTPRLG